MSFVRAEALATVARWREVAWALVPLAVGLWLASTPGLFRYLGWALLVLAAVLAANGIQRGRFRRTTDGPGLVTLDEGQITWFGPTIGGTLALSDVTKVSFDPAHGGLWRLTSPGGTLEIPDRASGIERLFDAFASLRGFPIQKMLEIRDHANHPTVIWSIRDQGLH